MSFHSNLLTNVQCWDIHISIYIADTATRQDLSRCMSWFDGSYNLASHWPRFHWEPFLMDTVMKLKYRTSYFERQTSTVEVNNLAIRIQGGNGCRKTCIKAKWIERWYVGRSHEKVELNSNSFYRANHCQNCQASSRLSLPLLIHYVWYQTLHVSH